MTRKKTTLSKPPARPGERTPKPASVRGETSGARPYQVTPQESEAIEEFMGRRKSSGHSPKYRVDYEGNDSALAADHAEPACTEVALANMLCTGETSFSSGILLQLAGAARAGPKLTSQELNFMIATVREIGPRDQTEALLACQMAAIHNATMLAARRLNQTETIDQQDSCSNMLNKLSRTFATQIEALKRYRSRGEQTVRVTHQHVNVTADNAVVGVKTGGGVTHENTSQSHALDEATQASEPNAPGTALLSKKQTLGAAMPRTSSPGQARVPHARSPSRSTNGQS